MAGSRVPKLVERNFVPMSSPFRSAGVSPAGFSSIGLENLAPLRKRTLDVGLTKKPPARRRRYHDHPIASFSESATLPN